MSIRLAACLVVCFVYITASLSVCLFICLYIHSSDYLLICLPVYMSAFLPIRPTVCLPNCWSACYSFKYETLHFEYLPPPPLYPMDETLIKLITYMKHLKHTHTHTRRLTHTHTHTHSPLPVSDGQVLYNRYLWWCVFGSDIISCRSRAPSYDYHDNIAAALGACVLADKPAACRWLASCTR